MNGGMDRAGAFRELYEEQVRPEAQSHAINTRVIFRGRTDAIIDPWRNGPRRTERA